MSGKASLRIIEQLERARIEGDWTHVSQYAEQLPKEYTVLKFVSLGECLLEGQQNGKISYNTLHLAKDYINKALSSKNDREGQYYKEAMLLQAKTCYIQGKFQECLDILDKVDMESMRRRETLSFNASRALADAYVYRGMAMEYLAIVSIAEEDTPIEKIVECYETAGDLGLELLNSISRSPLNLTLSGVLEIAILRSFLLQMSHGMVEKGINRLRRILQTADMPGTDDLRLTLSLTLGEVLLHGLSDNHWTALVHRETMSDTLSKRGRNTPTLKKYETVFCPCNKVEEAILTLLIGQALLYKEGCVSVHPEHKTEYAKSNKQAHLLLNLLVSLLARFSQFRPLADSIEKFLKFSHDDEHICRQFGLTLIASEQYVRGVAVLQKCHDRQVEVSLALVLAQTYIRHLARYGDAVRICGDCLGATEGGLKSRVYLYQGVAQAALSRSSKLREEQNLYNRKSIDSFQKSYSLDPHCPVIWYHLALRLASVGEIKKAFRFAHKVESSPGVVNMVDVSHLLALVLSAQNKPDEALNMVTLTLLNYPDNLNLMITKIMLERQVHGPHKALVTCKEVLLPLLEKLSTSTCRELLNQAYLPYSDQWTSGKFQLSQWSDKLSTNTTASFTGSTMGTLPAESVCESIDSTVGCDQSNWGYQAEVWYTIADVFLSEEMISDAQKCVDEIKLLFPLSHLVSYMNARIRESQDSRKEAEQQYINAVTLAPQHVPSLVALGRLEIELGKPILAEHYLVEATHLKPDEYEAWHYLGVLHQQEGEHQKAADCFLTALRFEASAPVRPYNVLNWKLLYRAGMVDV